MLIRSCSSCSFTAGTVAPTLSGGHRLSCLSEPVSVHEMYRTMLQGFEGVVTTTLAVTACYLVWPRFPSDMVDDSSKGYIVPSSCPVVWSQVDNFFLRVRQFLTGSGPVPLLPVLLM